MTSVRSYVWICSRVRMCLSGRQNHIYTIAGTYVYISKFIGFKLCSKFSQNDTISTDWRRILHFVLHSASNAFNGENGTSSHTNTHPFNISADSATNQTNNRKNNNKQSFSSFNIVIVFDSLQSYPAPPPHHLLEYFLAASGLCLTKYGSGISVNFDL